VPLTFGVLAAVAASSPPSNDVTPGVLGFLVVAAIGVALVFLLKSMNKQFRKIAPKDEAAVPEGAGSQPVDPGQPVHPGQPGQNAAVAQEAPK
jgi:hypothetical protein